MKRRKEVDYNKIYKECCSETKKGILLGTGIALLLFLLAMMFGCQSKPTEATKLKASEFELQKIMTTPEGANIYMLQTDWGMVSYKKLVVVGTNGDVAITDF